jgi:hypothetical protein
VTSAHIFFIPGMILVGMFLGFIFGARAARNQVDIERKREEEREAARAARAARRANNKGDEPPAEAVAEQKADDKVSDEKAAAKDDKPTKKTKGKSR